MHRTPRLTAAAIAVVMAATLAAAPLAAPTSATPIGPLPSGPTSVIQTQKGELVAVSLPNRANGRVWRIARAFNAGVIAQVGEADVGTTVVLVFKATGTGTTTLSFGLTRGDTGRKAFESRRFQVHVR